MPVRVSDIEDALLALGGRGHINDIEAQVRASAPPPLPKALAQTIRARLQENSSDAKHYKGRKNLFRSVHGVAARKGIWELREVGLADLDQGLMMDDFNAVAEEGALKLREHLSRERSRSLIRSFKQQLKSLACSVCDFDFAKKYGDLGTGYIEAHHTVPVASLQPGQVTRLSDLQAVCSNCHRMLHRNGLLDWRALRRQVNGS